MAVTTTNLGVITAYGDAVAAGYTGTKAEWQALMASYATVGQQAVDAKNDAVAAKNTAVSKATEATTAATTATTKASEASASAQSIAQSAAQIQENTDDITQLKEDLSEIITITVSKNRFDVSSIQHDMTLYSNGYAGASSGYNVSDFIDVSDINTVYLYIGKYPSNVTHEFYCCGYSSNAQNTKTFTETVSTNVWNEIDVENVSYIRFNYSYSDISDQKIIVADEEIAYSAYGTQEVFINPSNETIEARGTFASLNARLNSIDDELNYKITPYQYVKDGFLVCNKLINGDTSQVARYMCVDTGENNRSRTFVVKARFKGTNTGGNITVVSEPNGASSPRDITTKSVHISITPTAIVFGLFENGVNNNLKAFIYDQALDTSGETEYAFVCDYNPTSKYIEFRVYEDTDGIIYFATLTPIYTGTYTNHENPAQTYDFDEYFGRYSIIEHYIEAGGDCMALVSYLRFSGTHREIYDDFRRTNGVPTTSLSGHNYIHFYRTA